MKKCYVALTLWFITIISFAAPLPASEVFQVQAKKVDPNTFIINLQVKPGYFLYSDRIKLNHTDTSVARLGDIRFPKPLEKVDKRGRIFQVYRNTLSLPVPVLGQNPGETLVDLSYQGCSDAGFCYPPQTKQIKLSINNKLALSAVNIETEPTAPTKAAEPAKNEMVEIFNDHHWAFVILSFWAFGLLLAFTPCVLPMIPVLSGIIVGHGENLSTRKAFLLSLSYVLSMSITYAVIGAVVAQLGSNLQVLMQNPWSIGIFSFIFVLLALSMFGFFELRLPVSWQTRLAKANRAQSSGHYLSAAVMGCLSTLILSPCVTAPLIGALGYIAQTGNLFLGGAALFFLGLGMGTPLLLIGTTAGKWLPKAGKWMNSVKVFFGILLLGVAIILLDRILPKTMIMALWAILLVFSGIYCGALSSAKTAQAKLGQGLGLMLLLYGLLVLVGASMGNTNPLQPLARAENASSASTQFKTTIKSLPELQKTLTEAKGKPVLLDFYADWCHSCQVMEKTLFKDPKVVKALEDFVVIKVDLTANREQEKALMNQYKVVAPPTFLFLDEESLEKVNLRLVGETSKTKFLDQLKQATKK